MFKSILFFTIVLFLQFFLYAYPYTSDSSMNSQNETIIEDLSVIEASIKFSTTEEILNIVDFIRENKEFVKLSIFIHQTDNSLKYQNSAVELWHQLLKLGLSALVFIVQEPTVEREVNEEQLIFYSTEEVAIKTAFTMMSRLRPLYLISANSGCKIDLSEIATLIPADIEVYIVSLCDGTIYEAYHFDPDNPIVRAIAVKDEAMGIWLMKTNQSMWMRRKKMDGLKIYGKGFRPLIFDRNDPEYHAMMISDRYAVDVWNDLTEFLNFTLVIIEGSIGNDTKNSTPWDGMIGLLGSQEIDVPTNLVTVTERVAEGYAMKATVFTASFRLMFHSPLNHKHMLMPNVLHPFDEKLWLALVFMVFLILPSILALLLRKETDFGNAAILPLRCLASQGLGFSPTNTSARFGCLVTLFFCYLMVMYYQSLLITFLTSIHQYQPFSTLEEFYSKGYGFDLIYHKDMSWALLGDWQRSTSETSDPISKLALGVDPPKRNRVLPMSSRVEAAKRLCRFGSNTTIFDVPFRQAPLIRCPYSTTKHKYLLMHFGIGARHNLSAYPYITRMIRDMEEYGIIDRMKQSFRLTQYKSTFKSLSLDELGTVLVSYHFAMLFCIFLLVVELLWFYGCKFYMLKFSGKNKKVRRRYHNKRMKDLQKVLDLHNEFKKSK